MSQSFNTIKHVCTSSASMSPNCEILALVLQISIKEEVHGAENLSNANSLDIVSKAKGGKSISEVTFQLVSISVLVPPICLSNEHITFIAR